MTYENISKALAWFDYKKAYDVVPKIWIIYSLNMFNLSDKVINFKKTMKTWSV